MNLGSFSRWLDMWPHANDEAPENVMASMDLHDRDTGPFFSTMPSIPLGRKDDDEKVRYDLEPIESREWIARVLTLGAAKYGDHNWKYVERARDRYYAALQRHLTEWRKGNLFDTDTGLPHLAHAGCCILFLLWFDHRSDVE